MDFFISIIAVFILFVPPHLTEAKHYVGFPTVKVHKRVYHPVRGDMISLDCHFTYAGRVWWKRVKNGQEEPVDTDRTSGEFTESLTIQNVEQQDDGEYRCYGSNDISTTNGTITVLSGCKCDDIA